MHFLEALISNKVMLKCRNFFLVTNIITEDIIFRKICE